jgi:hypothetical protein
VDPQTQSAKLLWDEASRPHEITVSQLTTMQEELMFEEMSNPPKGKGKEKDVGKRRAYVRVVTSLGGSLNLELYCEKVGGKHHLTALINSYSQPTPGTKNVLQLSDACQSWQLR